MPCNKSHIGGLLEEERRGRKRGEEGQRLVPLDKSDRRQGEGERETGGGQDPAFKRELSKCLQDVLLVAAAGHFLSGQHPKVRLVQMPK